MKKLVALVLVLGLVSVTNAAFTISITGPTSLVASTAQVASIGTYTVSYSGEGLSSADIDVISDSGTQPYGITGGAVLATNRVTAYDWAALNTGTLNFELTAANDTPGVLGTTLFSFNFKAPTAVPTTNQGKVTLSLIENSFYEATFDHTISPDSMQALLVQITPVPEPITLALLGLGGLFIRRKK